MDNKKTKSIVKIAMQLTEQQKDLTKCPFNDIDGIIIYIKKHLRQKTKEERQWIIDMKSDEAYVHGMMEGIINTLMIVGYNIEAIGGMRPAVSKEEMDAVIRADRTARAQRK